MTQRSRGVELLQPALPLKDTADAWPALRRAQAHPARPPRPRRRRPPHRPQSRGSRTGRTPPRAPAPAPGVRGCRPAARGAGRTEAPPGHARRLLRQHGGGARTWREHPRAHPQAGQVVNAQRKVGQASRHRHGRARARAARERVRRGRVVRGALAPQQPGAPARPIRVRCIDGPRAAGMQTRVRRCAELLPVKAAATRERTRGSSRTCPLCARLPSSRSRKGRMRRDPLVHLDSPDKATQRSPHL